VEVASLLSFMELLNHKGIHLEKLKGLLTPDGRQQYSLRATQAARALATVAGETLVLLHGEADHDQAHP
jgi:predicted xylose isomerase-like sugar epimerase